MKLLLFTALALTNFACSNNPKTPTYMSNQDLLKKMAAKEPITTLDTRSESEYNSGHVPGAIHFPFWQASWKARSLQIAKDSPIVVYCAHGPRAGIAKASLLSHGFDNVMYLKGHMTKWNKDKLPVEKVADQ